MIERDPPNDLEPVTDKYIISRYLQYTSDLLEPISCLVESLSLRFEASAKGFQGEKLALMLEIESSAFGKLTSDQLVQLGRPGVPIRLSFAAADVLFFAIGWTTQRSANLLSLDIETPIYKLQRRQALRIKPLESHRARVNISSEIYEIQDISAAGLSIVIPQMKNLPFPKEKIFPQCTVRFASLHFNVNLQVVSLNRLRPGDDSLWKVGFRFLNIPPLMEQLIAKEAYLQSHKIWSRWL